MKAVKRSIEAQRAIEEAEKEIQRLKEEEEKTKAEGGKPSAPIRKANGEVSADKKARKEKFAIQCREIVAKYWIYALIVMAMMAISLAGAYYALSTAFVFFDGLGVKTGVDMFIGVVLIFTAILVPIGLIQLLYSIMSEDKYSIFAAIIPQGISFLITIIFIFVV